MATMPWGGSRGKESHNIAHYMNFILSLINFGDSTVIHEVLKIWTNSQSWHNSGMFGNLSLRKPLAQEIWKMPTFNFSTSSMSCSQWSLTLLACFTAASFDASAFAKHRWSPATLRTTLKECKVDNNENPLLQVAKYLPNELTHLALKLYTYCLLLQNI